MARQLAIAIAPLLPLKGRRRCNLAGDTWSTPITRMQEIQHTGPSTSDVNPAAGRAGAKQGGGLLQRPVSQLQSGDQAEPPTSPEPSHPLHMRPHKRARHDLQPSAVAVAMTESMAEELDERESQEDGPAGTRLGAPCAKASSLSEVGTCPAEVHQLEPACCPAAPLSQPPSQLPHLSHASQASCEVWSSSQTQQESDVTWEGAPLMLPPAPPQQPSYPKAAVPFTTGGRVPHHQQPSSLRHGSLLQRAHQIYNIQPVRNAAVKQQLLTGLTGEADDDGDWLL